MQKPFFNSTLQLQYFFSFATLKEKRKHEATFHRKNDLMNTFLG
jgi:hypothetical protein